MTTDKGYGAKDGELAVARERLAENWFALRESVRLESGSEPRWNLRKAWPVLAFAVGVAIGAGFWWRSRGD